MMRSPWRVATAVRDPEGAIRVQAYPFVSVTKRNSLARRPIVRGAVSLFEALSIGMKSLNWAAEVTGEEAGPATLKDRILGGVMMFVALAAGVGLFMAIPYAVAGLVPNSENQVIFHLVSGGLRIAILVGYMAAISLIPDIREVFRYHGAEHKSIFAYERKLDLTVANAICQSRFHPRCGTSFLLLAAVLTMLGFMLIDGVFYALGGHFANSLVRVAAHLPFIPIVAGAGFEVLKWAEKHSEDPVFRPLIQPGFWLQGITTREPDTGQVEVALAALHESLSNANDTYEGSVRTGVDDHGEQLVEPGEVAA